MHDLSLADEIIIQVVLVKFIDRLLILQCLKTKFNPSFLMDSRWFRLSLVKNIFVSSANIRKDSFLSS